LRTIKIYEFSNLGNLQSDLSFICCTYWFVGVYSPKKEWPYQVLRLNMSPFLKVLKRSSLFIICEVIFTSKWIFQSWLGRTTLEQYLCRRMLRLAFVLGTWIHVITLENWVYSAKNDSDLAQKEIFGKQWRLQYLLIATG
jgi:hypothetical protein